MDLAAVAATFAVAISALTAFAAALGFLACLTHLVLLCMGAIRGGSAADHGAGGVGPTTFAHPGGAALPSYSGRLLPAEIASLPAVAYSVDGAGSANCAVCMALLEENQRVRRLPGCNHSFHAECIDGWLLCSATCPLCRSPVKPKSHVIEMPPPFTPPSSSPPPTSSSRTSSDEELRTDQLTSSSREEFWASERGAGAQD